MSTLQGGTQSFAGGTSESFTTPYPHALGTKARDAVGNEYVLCNVGAATIAPEMCVIINSDWSLTALTTSGAKGAVGVVADLGKAGNTSAPVSPYPANVAVWVQVYGRAFVQCGGGGVSPSDAANGPTTVTTSDQIFFRAPTTVISTPVGQVAMTTGVLITTVTAFTIDGMTVATDASLTSDATAVTAVSATHYGYRVPVWLNYPKVQPAQATVSTS